MAGARYDIAQKPGQHVGVELAGIGDIGMLGHAETQPVRRVDPKVIGERREDGAVLKIGGSGIEVMQQE